MAEISQDAIDINSNNLILEFGNATNDFNSSLVNDLSSQIESSTIQLSTTTINSSKNVSSVVDIKTLKIGNQLCDDTDYLYAAIKDLYTQITEIKNFVTNNTNIIYYVVIANSDNKDQGVVTGGGTYKKGDTVQISASPNVGYEFYRWSDDSIQNPRLFTIDQDISLTGYFVWDDNYVKVTFNPNGGVMNNDECTCIVHKNVIISNPPNDPEFTGYSFIGWFDAAEHGNQIDLATYTFSDDITLYAHYLEQKSQYIVLLDENGGSCISSYINVNFGEQIGDIPEATLNGYEFLGWYHLNENNVKEFTDSDFIPESNIVLTAYYTNSEFVEITYDSNDDNSYITIYFNAGSGGTCETSETTIIKGSHLTELPECKTTLYGYRFIGWFTSETGGTKIDLYALFDDDTTIYAQYSKVENVVYDEVPIKITYAFPNFDFTGDVPTEKWHENTASDTFDKSINDGHQIWWKGKTEI